jgi:NAD(P)-dependent dehydrogenase (short-subunit alcohol dehydrogenase family)
VGDNDSGIRFAASAEKHGDETAGRRSRRSIPGGLARDQVRHRLLSAAPSITNSRTYGDLSMKILVTGSNRGLGLELVRQYAEDGWRVYATCRHPAEAEDLRPLAEGHADISIHRLDVTRAQDMRSIAWELGDEPLDLLVNNAGIYLEQQYDLPHLGAIRYDDWLETFAVNTLGAVRLTEALIGNLRAAPRPLVAVMTSHMGSIGDIDMPGSLYYRSSKAALNAVMQGVAAELEPAGIGVLLLHPGGVATRMGPSGGIAVEESVRGLRRQIGAFEPAQTGRFVRYDGTEMPW